MSTETKSVFPKIPASAWWTLRTQFKRSIPTVITSNYLASILKTDEASARSNVMPALRAVGIADNDGKVNTENANRMRSDDQYKAFCQDALHSIYPEELIQAFPTSNPDREGIERWIMNHSKVGEAAAKKYAGFYLTLLLGEIVSESEVKQPSGVRSGAKERTSGVKINRQAQVKSKLATTTVTEGGHPLVEQHKKKPAPEVHINVQVHIASDATNEQIEKIFESMGKHLFNKAD